MMRRQFIFWMLFLLSFGAYARDLPDFTELVERHGPAVVNISTSQTVRSQGFPQIPNLPENDPFFDFFRRFMPPGGAQPREYETKSLGSGFIISADGYIMTNSHVVDAANEVNVRLTDKREFKAKVIGSDKRTDIALIKINATNLPRVSLGDPYRLKVGEWVAAIGSPFGFENSVTAGIVSAKGRALPDDGYVPFIQTDVAINPGNSGGPLFNLQGEVVGINSQIYSRTGGFMGLSFAIPIDVAMDVVNQLRTSGKVSRGWLGVVIQPLTRDLAESFGLNSPSGALIADVSRGSPAERAGLEASDVILKFDGKPIQESYELPRLVGTTKPGKNVVLQVWRKGALKDINLVIGELPADKAMPQRPELGGAPKSANRAGLALSELSPAQKQQLRIEGGALVEDAQGTAARSGLRRGDVILAINNTDVRSAEQANRLLNEVPLGRSVAVLVKRGETALYVPLRIEAAK